MAAPSSTSVQQEVQGCRSVEARDCNLLGAEQPTNDDWRGNSYKPGRSHTDFDSSGSFER
jgi:hypothetical protein